jgi:hypothetical protein
MEVCMKIEKSVCWDGLHCDQEVIDKLSDEERREMEAMMIKKMYECKESFDY